MDIPHKTLPSLLMLPYHWVSLRNRHQICLCDEINSNLNMYKSNISQGAVTSVKLLHTTQPFLHRRALQESKLAQKVNDNVLTTEQVGPLTFNYLKFNSQTKSTFDTSKRYIMIGDRNLKYKTNIEWTNKGGLGKKWGYKKGGLTTFTTARMNPNPFRDSATIAKGRRTKLAPQLIPSDKINDAKKADPIIKEEEETRLASPIDAPFAIQPVNNYYQDDSEFVVGQEQLPAYFKFLKPVPQDKALKKFCYDDFERTVDRDLLKMYREKLGIVKHVELVVPSYSTPLFISTPKPRKERVPLFITEALNTLDAMQLDKILEETVDANDEFVDAVEHKTVDNPHFKYPSVPQTPAEEFNSIPRHHRDILARLDVEGTFDVNGDLYRKYLATPPDDRMRFLILEERLRNSDYSSDSDEESVISTAKQVLLAGVQNKWNSIRNYASMPARINSAVDSVNEVFSKVNEATDKANTFIDHITTLVQSYVSKLPVVSTLIDYATVGGHITNLLHDIYNYSIYSLPALIFKIGFSISCIFRFCTQHIFHSPAVFEAITQSWSPATFLTLITNNKMLLDVGKTFNSFAQIRNGLSSIDSFINWVRDYLPQFLTDIVDYYHPDPKAFNKRFCNFAIFVRQTADVMDKKEKLSDDVIVFVRKEIAYFDPFLLIPSAKRDVYLAYRSIRDLSVKIEVYYDQYLAYTTARQCPFSVVVHGASRIGKTVVMSAMANIMAAVDKHSGPVSYTRISKVPHWDGFSDKTYAIVYDDWLQSTEYEDVSEYFSLVTKQHYIVPMASLDDPIVGKKGTLCMARVVLAATNMMSPDAVSTKINCPAALFNRIACRIHAESRREHGVKIDYDTSGEFKHLSFKFITIHSGLEHKSDSMSFKDMMRELIKIKTRHEKQQQAIDDIPVENDFISELREYTTQSATTNLWVAGLNVVATGFGASMMYRLNGIAIDTLMGDGNHMNPIPRTIIVGLTTVVGMLLPCIMTFQATKHAVVRYYDHRNQLTAMHVLVVLNKLNYPLDPESLLRANRYIDDYSKLTRGAMYRKCFDLLQRVIARGDHVDEVTRFFKLYTPVLVPMISDQSPVCESRTFEEKNSPRKKYTTEAGEKRIRQIMGAESRTMEEKNVKRKFVVTESQELEDSSIVKHSKFAASPFYSQQNELTQDFTRYKNAVIDKDVLELIVDPEYVTQGTNDPAALDCAETVSSRMLPLAVVLVTKMDTMDVKRSTITFINAIPLDNHRVLIPKHALIDDDGQFLINTKTSKYCFLFRIEGINHSVDFDPERVTYLVNSAGDANIDAAIYDLSRTSVPARRSVLNQFIRERDLAQIVDGDYAVMVGHTLDKGIPSKFQKFCQVRPLSESVSYKHPSGKSFTISRGLRYAAETKPGDCGSPLIHFKASNNNKIIGIHCFGTTGSLNGGGLIVTYEMIMRVLTNAQKVIPLDVKFTVTDKILDMRKQAQGLTVEVVGELVQPSYVNRKTAYVQTPLFEHFAEKTNHPSEKYNSEGFDPLLVGTQLFGSQLNNYDEPEIKAECLSYLRSHYPNVPAKIFSIDEAINRYESMDKMNLDTSPGLPYTLNGESKRTYFACDPDTGIVSVKDPVYMLNLEKYVEAWKDSVRETMWNVSIKDSLDKKLDGYMKLARVFEVAPMDHTVSVRVYFASWISAMHSTAGKFFSCIGMNPESTQWTDMYYDLASVSDVGIDADAPNWDKNLSPTLMYWAIESVNQWYKDNDPNWKVEHDQARINLVQAMINSYLVSGRYLFRKHKGMPSGAVLTALLNTVVNMIMHLIWFLKSVPVAYQTVAYYDKFVRTKIYGDDSIDAIHVDMLEYLNRHTMIDVYKKCCSMIITSSLKDGNLIPHEPIINLTFLKRGFRREGLFVKPLLSVKSLYSMISYVKRSSHISLEDQLVTNIKQVCSFAYFYGRSYYKNFIYYFSLVYPTVTLPPYSYFDNMFLYGKYDVTPLF